MKISKSKQELARIVSENGGWCDGAEWATQDHVVAFFSGGKPKYETYDKTWCANGDDGVFIAAMSVDGKIGGFHQTILSRAEYSHLYPSPDADGWIEWGGGNERPVKGRVDIKNRNGFVVDGADSFIVGWGHDGTFRDIIAYRLHKPEQAKPEFCQSVMRSIPEPEAKPTIEQLAADYRNAKEYAGRKQQEADDAKADADEKLRVLEIAGEALGLLVSPINAKQEPELVITDWRQWRVGDVVSWSLLNHVGEFEIISVHHDQSRNIGDFEVEDKPGDVYRVYGDECRFIRRP